MKTFELNSVVMGCIRYEYFYKREKNDINGNSRFHVYMIDPEHNAVYERIIQCYEFQVKNHIEIMIERMLKNE